MNFVIDKLNIIFKDKKVYFFIVLIMFCLGIFFGFYIVKYMGVVDKSDLMNYFLSFISFIGNEFVNYGSLLFEVIKKNMFLIVFIFILGLIFFGVFIILILDLIKGFILGYMFFFMVIIFEGKGIGLVLVFIIF